MIRILIFLLAGLCACSDKSELINFDQLSYLEVYMLPDGIHLPVALSEESIRLLEPYEIREEKDVDQVKLFLKNSLEQKKVYSDVKTGVRIICQLHFLDGSKIEMGYHDGRAKINGKFYKIGNDILPLLKELRPDN